MIELLALLGIGAAGMGGMWIKTRRRTNTGNTRAAVDKFDDAADRVSSAQARWYDLQIEASIAGGGLDDGQRAALETAEAKARESSRELYDAWLPVSDVSNEDIASFNDQSRREVSTYKQNAIRVVEVFERDLDQLERVIEGLKK